MTDAAQPADPLDLASLFGILAPATCPAEVRAAMIAVLQESITPEQEARTDELLALSDAELDALDISPGVRELLRATRFLPDAPGPPRPSWDSLVNLLDSLDISYGPPVEASIISGR